MKRFCLLTVGLPLVLVGYMNAQSIAIPFDMNRWDTTNAKVWPENYLGQQSILLESGSIYVKDVDFLDGIIEADINFPKKRCFPGIAFRLQDRGNFEYFYVRPHQSGNPDANQYTPVFNRLSGWQLYYGEGYAAPFTYQYDHWHHIKIDVHGLQAEIYIDDMQKPLIRVKELKRDWKAGKIGFVAGGGDVHFANLRYTPKTGQAPVALPVPANGTDGQVTRWQVSNVVNHRLFDKQYQLTRVIKKALRWTSCSSEPSGIINLAKYAQRTDSDNVVVAKVSLESATDQVKALSFGFSDYVAVFLNDQLLYSGKDDFMSRDYRFLGTVGYYDRLYLPLKKGKNELWFVVAEDFGGWGVQAKWENLEGIRLE